MPRDYSEEVTVFASRPGDWGSYWHECRLTGRARMRRDIDTTSHSLDALEEFEYVLKPFGLFKHWAPEKKFKIMVPGKYVKYYKKSLTNVEASDDA